MYRFTFISSRIVTLAGRRCRDGSHQSKYLLFIAGKLDHAQEHANGSSLALYA